MVKFLHVDYAVAPVANGGAAEREAKRLAAACNNCAGIHGDCTVGKLTCPFLIHVFENDTGTGRMCSVITPDDWLRLLEVK